MVATTFLCHTPAALHLITAVNQTAYVADLKIHFARRRNFMKLLG
jgi:hypothetical protein